MYLKVQGWQNLFKFQGIQRVPSGPGFSMGDTHINTQTDRQTDRQTNTFRPGVLRADQHENRQGRPR